jgi:hypothetical protein
VVLRIVFYSYMEVIICRLRQCYGQFLTKVVGYVVPGCSWNDCYNRWNCNLSGIC